MSDFFQKLSEKSADSRLSALKTLDFAALPPVSDRAVEHIHTTYSFSPYSPTAAAYSARAAGAKFVGIVDHDTLAGAGELRTACEILGTEPMYGLECRVRTGGGFEGFRTNNPDETGISYMTLQRVPFEKTKLLTDALAPLRVRRAEREREITERALSVFPETELDFARDVLPLSLFSEGGTVTERHVLFALSMRLGEIYGRGDYLVSALRKRGICLSPERCARLSDDGNVYFFYDLAHTLKGELMPRIYASAHSECMALSDFVSLAETADAVCCYAYLGDVSVSITDDKKAGKFEDAFLPELLSYLKNAGVRAVTHSRKRNTAAQTEYLLTLCNDIGLMTVEGEDINSPRQSFI